MCCWPARSAEAAGVGTPHSVVTNCSRRCASCPTPWSRCIGDADEIAEAARRFAPLQALLGDRRQRAQRGRRRGGADQAQRALLQVDRLRRHRGQEAHRPVERAAHPRVRRRSRRRHRRRRGQGGRDLSSAHKATPIVIATEGGRTLRRCCCQVLTVPAVDLCRLDVRARPRWSATCSATRPRCAIDGLGTATARGAPRDRWMRSPSFTEWCRRRASSTRCARDISAPAPRSFLDGLRAGTATTVTWRPPPRCGWWVMLGAATSAASSRWRPTRRATGKIATPGDDDRRPHGRAHAGDRGAHPPRSTRSSIRPRRSPSASRRNDEGRARHRALVRHALMAGAGPRPAELPHPEGARRRWTPPWRRSPVTPATRSRATPTLGPDAAATITIVDRGGLSARGHQSRVDRVNSQLLGTKRRVASEKEVLVAQRSQPTGAR